jgi:hypothetical protein
MIAFTQVKDTGPLSDVPINRSRPKRDAELVVIGLFSPVRLNLGFGHRPPGDKNLAVNKLGVLLRKNNAG